jgi:hypothetical protein
MNVEKIFKWNKRVMLFCIVVIPVSFVLLVVNFPVFGGNPPPNPRGDIISLISFIVMLICLLLFFGIMIFEPIARLIVFHKQSKQYFDKK